MRKNLLLWVLAALTLLISAQALAAQDTAEQTWRIKFQKFIYVWINTDEVIFDFTVQAQNIDQNTDGVLVNGSINSKTVYVAAKDTLYHCSGQDQDFSSYSPGSNTFTGIRNAPNSNSDVNCYFAPTEIVIDSGDGDGEKYDASYDYDDSNAVAYADTDLLVAALGINHFKVQQISADTTIPSGLTLLFFPGAAVDGNLVTKDGGQNPANGVAKLSGSNNATPNWKGGDYGYYVDGMYFYYLMPVSHALKLDPKTFDLGTFTGDTYTQDIKITYTVSSL